MDKDPVGHSDLVIGSQLQRKRKHNDSDPNHSNGSDNSTRITQDGSSSPSSPNAATTTVMSAMLGFSLRGSMEPQEGPRVHTPSFDVKIDTSMPPRYMKLINELQVEKESLKLQMFNAQSMINNLCSRIESLNKENEDLKQMKAMGPHP